MSRSIPAEEDHHEPVFPGTDHQDSVAKQFLFMVDEIPSVIGKRLETMLVHTGNLGGASRLVDTN